MNLEKINTQTTWEAAVGSINGNHSKINEAVIRLENATYKNKGYYRSLDELEANVPVPSNGSKAYVGNKYPYRIYISSNGVWMDSGETGGDESVSLENLYTKDDIVVLPQAEFDALKEAGLLDPYKEYNTYED